MHTLASCQLCQKGDRDGGRAQADLDSEMPPSPIAFQLGPVAFWKVGYL